MGALFTPHHLWRLLAAMLVGGVIGIEREMHDRPAGLRTHILVCVGSALIMIVSQQVSLSFAGQLDSDPARIAAQVVSGIGFLGAGTILREGANVRGLTTAASLWICAALGLAVGAGMYIYGLATAVLTLVALSVLFRVEHYLALQRSSGKIELLGRDRPGLLGQVGSILGELDINVANVRMSPRSGGSVHIELYVNYPAQLEKIELMQRLEELSGIEHMNIDDER